MVRCMTISWTIAFTATTATASPVYKNNNGCSAPITASHAHQCFRFAPVIQSGTSYRVHDGACQPKCYTNTMVEGDGVPRLLKNTSKAWSNVPLNAANIVSVSPPSVGRFNLLTLGTELLFILSKQQHVCVHVFVISERVGRHQHAHSGLRLLRGQRLLGERAAGVSVSSSVYVVLPVMQSQPTSMVMPPPASAVKRYPKCVCKARAHTCKSDSRRCAWCCASTKSNSVAL